MDTIAHEARYDAVSIAVGALMLFYPIAVMALIVSYLQ